MPRKTFGGGAGPRAAAVASMRPRPDAAENASIGARPIGAILLQ